MEWYEQEVAGLEKQVSQRAELRGRVVFYGSSSIRLWSTLAEDFPEWSLVNVGFGGSTLAACVHFFPRLVVPLAPARLVVYAGDNDLGDGVAPAVVAQDLARLLRLIKEAWPQPPPVWFISIKPSPSRWGLERAILACNDLCRDALSAYPMATMLDGHSGLLGADGRPRRECYQGDGLHLSPAGYAVWRQVLRKAAGWAEAGAGAEAGVSAGVGAVAGGGLATGSSVKASDPTHTETDPTAVVSMMALPIAAPAVAENVTQTSHTK